MIVLTMPVMPIFVLLSVATRISRKIGLSLCPHKAEEDRQFRWLTKSAWEALQWLFSNTTGVLTWVCYVAMFYFICDVGVGKGATLFLGWMISVMSSLHPAVVLVAFVALGVGMFLLPPVPGPPVYLTGGVLVVGSLQESMGYWGAVLVCILVCWVTKLVSCALQQKMIGENLSGVVAVRYAVGINSLQMRAIRYCLMQPGLNPAKIAILCGGPDWPTSVLCGILRVPLAEAMIGTAPVIVLYLGFTVLAGAFQLKIGGVCDSKDEAVNNLSLSPPPSPPPSPLASTGTANYWEMWAAVVLGVAMVAMCCTSFAAVYFMENTIENKREEIDAYPDDEEVKAREQRLNERREVYADQTKWDNLPWTSRCLLGGAAVFMTAACHTAGNFGSYCFATFTVTCTVALVDVVKPLGWVAIGTFCFGFFLFRLYLVGASARTKFAMEKGALAVDEAAPNR